MVLVAPRNLNNLSDVDLTNPSELEVLQFDGTNWVNIVNSTIPRFAIVTADQTHTPSSTTYENVTEIVMSLKASKRYTGACVFYFNSSAVANIKNRFSIPSGTSGAQLENPPVTAASNGSLTAGQVQSGGGVDKGMVIWFMLKTDTTAGNFQWQFAQNTSEASDTKILEHSYMIIWEVGDA